ncbi:MAG TPA: DUF6268 family outer membrane beta-barrel protein [Planctomicrobium sp.]|nr:DUF6268 family outer membrane beta-barrel protein [Planctomicrobium sp.]
MTNASVTWSLPTRKPQARAGLLMMIFIVLVSSTAMAEDPYGFSDFPFEEDSTERHLKPFLLDEVFDDEEPPLVPEIIPSESAFDVNRHAVRGSGGPGIGSGPGGIPGYRVTWYPSRPVSGQQGELAVLHQNLTAGMPLWADDGQALIFNFTVQNSHYSGNVILPDTGRPFPSDLWDVSFGLNYLRQFDNGWTGLLMASAGASGDEPFQSSNEINMMLGGMLLIPARNQRDSWTFGVMYSPAGTLNFPIPMVAYSWSPSESFQMNIGLPFRLH